MCIRDRGKVEKVESEKAYGLVILKYICPFGELNLIRHKLLEGAVYGNYAIALDMENVSFRYLRDTMELKDRQENDEDAEKGEYLTECGLQVEQEKTHAIASFSDL